MTIRECYQRLMFQLYEIYSDSEAANIADWVMEYVTGQRKIDRVSFPDIPVNDEQQAAVDRIAGELMRHRPVQYVLGEAWFVGAKYFVDESVLVPRPETEELVDWIATDIGKNRAASIIDIGTGSGCIPIALKKRLPLSTMRAIDVSEGAINVAARNAINLGAQVYFLRLDFLDEANWTSLGNFDIIVSNPPYIRQSEASTMHPNVLEHEPHLALFVPGDDALLFYRKIAAFAKEHLAAGGALYLEINEALGVETQQLFIDEGFDVTLRKDMQDKERMIRASKR